VAGSISVNEGHRIAHEFKDYLQGQLPEINDVLIHIEPFENKNRTDQLKQPITL
jgi:divalent metal cation (Fe/Co/Zn/Cd) transporter